MTHKQKVLALLADGKPHGHMEGYRLGVMLHSRVADLRRDGYEIVCWREGGDYLYLLVGQPPEVAPEPFVSDPYLCADCGRRFFNLGWHAEACGSPNYQRLSALKSPAIEEPGPQPVSLAGGSSAGDHAPSKGGRSAGRRATTETQALDSIEQPTLFSLPHTYGEAA